MYQHNMKKIISIITVFVLTVYSVNAQQKLWNASSGEVKFFSKAPLEDIEAVNKQATSIINPETNDVVAKIPIKGFVFPNGLMQEHFNENYMESDKFPNGTFRGKLTETIDFSKDGVYQVSASGKFNLHGVEKDKTIKGKLTISQGKATLETAFDVLLADYKIDIPTLVFQKIAEKIAVNTKFVFVAMDKKQ